MSEKQKSVFDVLNTINVNEKVEKKSNLTYLSWAWAWAEVKKQFPNANYVIKKFGSDNLPYVYDEKTGYMVFTEMTIEDITHEMWLFVMDSNNKAMKNQPYTYKVKKYVWNAQKGKNEWKGEYEDKEVEAATMFDINKTIMRCLTKNIAMFGLGLYIYAGEDLPEGDNDTEEELKKVNQALLKCNDLGINLKEMKTNNWIIKFCGWSKPVEIMTKQDMIKYEQALSALIELKERVNAEADKGA